MEYYGSSIVDEFKLRKTSAYFGCFLTGNHLTVFDFIKGFI